LGEKTWGERQEYNFGGKKEEERKKKECKNRPRGKRIGFVGGKTPFQTGNVNKGFERREPTGKATRNILKERTAFLKALGGGRKKKENPPSVKNVAKKRKGGKKNQTRGKSN